MASEWKSWVNEYGYDEGYLYKKISFELSGHIYRNSAMETADSCGNCDGARCDDCEKVWTVWHFGEPVEKDTGYGWSEWETPVLSWRRFLSEEEAIKYYETLE